MLRNMLLALGATMVVAGIGGLFTAYFAPALVLVVWGAMIAFAIIYERYSSRYRKVTARAPAGKNWIQTNEKLIDKKSGRAVVVYYQTWTGERVYVPLTEPTSEAGA